MVTVNAVHGPITMVIGCSTLIVRGQSPSPNGGRWLYQYVSIYIRAHMCVCVSEGCKPEYWIRGCRGSHFFCMSEGLPECWFGGVGVKLFESIRGL